MEEVRFQVDTWSEGRLGHSEWGLWKPEKQCLVMVPFFLALMTGVCLCVFGIKGVEGPVTALLCHLHEYFFPLSYSSLSFSLISSDIISSDWKLWGIQWEVASPDFGFHIHCIITICIDPKVFQPTKEHFLAIHWSLSPENGLTDATNYMNTWPVISNTQHKFN